MPNEFPGAPDQLLAHLRSEWGAALGPQEAERLLRKVEPTKIIAKLNEDLVVEQAKHLQTGDILLLRKRASYGALLNRVSAGMVRLQGPARFTHAALYVGLGLIIDATPAHPVHQRPLSRIIADYDIHQSIVLRTSVVPDGSTIRAIYEQLARLYRRKYNFRFLLAKRGKGYGDLFCSELVAAVYKRLEHPDFRDVVPSKVLPDDLLDRICKGSSWQQLRLSDVKYQIASRPEKTTAERPIEEVISKLKDSGIDEGNLRFIEYVLNYCKEDEYEDVEYEKILLSARRKARLQTKHIHSALSVKSEFIRLCFEMNRSIAIQISRLKTPGDQKKFLEEIGLKLDYRSLCMEAQEFLRLLEDMGSMDNDDDTGDLRKGYAMAWLGIFVKRLEFFLDEVAYVSLGLKILSDGVGTILEILSDPVPSNRQEQLKKALFASMAIEHSLSERMSSIGEGEVFAMINDTPDGLLWKLLKVKVESSHENVVLAMCVLALWSSRLKLVICHGVRSKEDTKWKELYFLHTIRARFAELDDDLKAKLKLFYKGPTLERNWL